MPQLFQRQTLNREVTGLVGPQQAPPVDTGQGGVPGLGVQGVPQPPPPEVQTQNIQIQGPNRGINLAADFLTGFGGGPGAATKQQAQRSAQTERLFGAQQRVVDLKTQLIQQQFKNRLGQSKEERDELATFAKLFSLTEEGGTVTLGGQSFKIPGISQAEAIKIKSAEELAFAKKKGESRAEILSAMGKAIQLGHKPGTNEFNAVMAEALGIKQRTSLKTVLSGLNLDPELVEDVSLTPDAAARFIRGIVGARERSAATRSLAAAARGKLPASAQAALRQSIGIKSKLDEIRKIVDKNKGIIGPAIGTFNALKRGAGLPTGPGFLQVPQEFRKVATELQGVINQLLKIRSGAAVTDQEFKRIALELAQTSNNIDEFNTRIAVAIRDIDLNIQLIGLINQQGGNLGAALIGAKVNNFLGGLPEDF
ncbi:hypothetical protein LCGC14_1364500 [marine sediment metagenome]|uniref:Uncharacterized protein n=1 Tax=marine sediment metagenome TaxID=412755 RepID=A0A0F9MMB9_9ZZZZ